MGNFIQYPSSVIIQHLSCITALQLQLNKTVGLYIKSIINDMDYMYLEVATIAAAAPAIAGVPNNGTEVLNNFPLDYRL